MKTIAVILTTLLLVSFRQADDNTGSTAASPAAKLVITIHGSEYVYAHQPYFYSTCLTAEVANPSSEEATFTMETGTLLSPDNPDLQQMIITRNEQMIIGPHSKKKVLLYAMCTQADNGAPVPKTKYVLNGKAPDSWTGLATLIAEHGFQDMAGQTAMWVLTDNHPVTDIAGAGTLELSLLKEYVSHVKQQQYVTPAPAPKPGKVTAYQTKAYYPY